MMHCSISGEVAQQPVISAKSGHIYEKRIILKALDTNKGVDPVTNEPLAPEDLLDVKTNPIVKPRPAAASSVPGILQLFQNEWDSLMLEGYTLKKQLESTRQDLAHSLYQHDAACRVIARLIQERDEAREALSNYKSRKGNAADEMDVDSKEGLPEEVLSLIQSTNESLSKDRKKRQPAESLATPEAIKEYSVQSSTNTHSPSQPGILAVDVHPQDGNQVLTGGVDGTVILFDAEAKKISKTFKGHSKKVNDVEFHANEELFFSASADKTARVWAKEGEKAVFTTTVHENEVTGLSIHPSGSYFLTASLDHTWAFHDFSADKTLLRSAADRPLATVHFHPDGSIFGTGEEAGAIKIWDIRTAKNVVSFAEHKKSSNSICFSENGFYLATASEDNTVLLWDLRKQQKFHSIELPADFGLSSTRFDYSGKYLLVTGADIKVYTGKTFTLVGTYNKHSGAVTDAAWAPDAKSFVSVSVDKAVKVWSHK